MCQNNNLDLKEKEKIKAIESLEKEIKENFDTNIIKCVKDA